MKFTLKPVLSTIKTLYESPRDRKRFERYLWLLQEGNKDDLQLPIAGYNPMGGPLALSKLQELQTLAAEQVTTQVLRKLNNRLTQQPNVTIEVVLNLADDLEGAWSQRYLTDYQCRFATNSLTKRNFCTPFFWTSEDYSEALIADRVRAAALRTYYELEQGPPQTLAECWSREQLVLEATQAGSGISDHWTAEQKAFYQQHRDSTDYHHLFNFFFGDAAARALGYPDWELGKGMLT